ncbi:AAA family ATPase [Tumidithrix elongata RA019]|uniref:AAA family ATPase n=1 Tax=Tumidithrix elongata BACA0141 TaxID=2716417 RepID=A0AAW9PX64_9CYAN|nr:AAA family ATPase [Tumidithrix elongata RA019]
MKIKQLEYYDRAKGWRLEPVQFSNLNLLVGVSGAGKTKILNAISNLKKVANGESLNGVEWEIILSAKDNKEYRWIGKFKLIEESETSFFYELGNIETEILTESLFINEKLLVRREGDEIKFQGDTLPKLSSFKSVIEIFKNEDIVKPVWEGFQQINYSGEDTAPSRKLRYHAPLSILTSKYPSEKDIIRSGLETQVKLALIYQNVPKLFEEIKERFLQVFPTVEDIKIEPFNSKATEKLFITIREFPFIFIKETGVDDWIDQREISSGMYKTIIDIAELYLSENGSVIIVDEFENSLGINCIDAITEDLISGDRDLQFILTSHHPYIINNIPMEYWKIVSRKGGVVTVKSAKELNLGKSKHQAYLQLINKLETYNEEKEIA